MANSNGIEISPASRRAFSGMEVRVAKAIEARDRAEERARAAEARAENLEGSLSEIILRLNGIERAMKDHLRAPQIKPRISTDARVTAEQGDVLYGLQAIAEFMGVTVRQAKHRAAKGEIPTFNMGRMICATKSGLSASIRAREAAANGGI